MSTACVTAPGRSTWPWSRCCCGVSTSKVARLDTSGGGADRRARALEQVRRLVDLGGVAVETAVQSRRRRRSRGRRAGAPRSSGRCASRPGRPESPLAGRGSRSSICSSGLRGARRAVAPGVSAVARVAEAAADGGERAVGQGHGVVWPRPRLSRPPAPRCWASSSTRVVARVVLRPGPSGRLGRRR